MKSIVRNLIIVVVIGGGVAVVAAMARLGNTVVQPIAFNHAVHIDAAGAQCLDCHTDGATAVRAGIPGKAVCLDCHDIEEEAEEHHPEKDKLFAFDEIDGDIPWVRVALTRPDVFFSHRRHVTAARLDCLTCHPDQPTLTAPPSTARLVMRMAACQTCHDEHAARNDCLACHR